MTKRKQNERTNRRGSSRRRNAAGGLEEEHIEDESERAGMEEGDGDSDDDDGDAAAAGPEEGLLESTRCFFLWGHSYYCDECESVKQRNESTARSLHHHRHHHPDPDLHRSPLHHQILHLHHHLARRRPLWLIECGPLCVVADGKQVERADPRKKDSMQQKMRR